MSTGWTWDYIAENMDIPRLTALNEYWADNPPLHIMVKSLVGIKPKEIEDEGHLAELMASIPETPRVTDGR